MSAGARSRLSAAGAAPAHDRYARQEWLKALAECSVCAPYIPILSRMKLESQPADRARAEGAEIARLAIPFDCLIFAVERYIENRLPSTPAGRLSALLRWGAEYQSSLLAGYNSFAESERQALELRAEDADERCREKIAELRELYEKERRRLAQDLHDEVGHDLVVLKLYMELAARDLDGRGSARLRHKLDESVGLIQHAIKGVRHLTFALGPALWDAEDFISGLRLYVRRFAARTDLKVRFNSGKLRAPLSRTYETALYKALQGALANVAAHAGASQVAITLSSDDTSVVMTVADDGKGFDVRSKLKAPQRSFGLRAMRERIENLGGTIVFRSGAPGKGNSAPGTLVEIRLPIEHP